MVDRVVHSFVPRLGTNFLRDRVKDRPDLYGPLWIPITLVFAMGFSGNLAGYANSLGAGGHDTAAFHYDFAVGG